MPTTLTAARDDVTRAVANLRAIGCKVHTILGHDPASGRYNYGVRVPAGVHPVVVGRSLTLEQQARMFAAVIMLHPIEDDVVVVSCAAPRREVGKAATLQRRIDAAEAVACALNHVAHRVERFDRKGSASVQHRIDTGWYLTTEPGYALSLDERPKDPKAALVEQWRAAAKRLEFEGDEYDGGQDEAEDAMSKVYSECADALAALI